MLVPDADVKIKDIAKGTTQSNKIDRNAEQDEPQRQPF